MNRALTWISEARSFHSRQRGKHRKVIRLGKTRFMLSRAHAVTAAGAILAAGSVSSEQMPDWIFWTLLLSGYFGGRFVFPVPDSSIASKRGPADVSSKNAAELDTMTPEDIRVYENNMVLKHRIKDLKPLGTAQALVRRDDAARSAERAADLPEGSLNRLSLADARAFGAASQVHDSLRKRWLSYEIDSTLQFNFPAMSDASLPATSAMIRAMHHADDVKSRGRVAEYQSAVASFEKALKEAEVAAGVPQALRLSNTRS